MTFQYDLLGHVTRGTGAFGTDNYTYDAMGSVTARKLGNTTQAAYTYNGDARLATAAGATLKYNAFGQRHVETVTGGGTHFLFGPRSRPPSARLGPDQAV